MASKTKAPTQQVTPLPKIYIGPTRAVLGLTNGTVYDPIPDIVDQLKEELPALGKLFVSVLTVPKAEAQINAGRGVYALWYKRVNEWRPEAAVPEVQ